MTLAATDLEVGYRKALVLTGVTVADLKPGTVTGLIGPNASGKSTLMKAIAGFLRPYRGAIALDGASLARMGRSQRAQTISYMPQSFASNALLSVFEAVLLSLKQGSGWRVKALEIAKVNDTLDGLGISHLSSRGMDTLSGGQAQMVAVAQAIVRRPSVLLLDEPTSALDVHHQLSILNAVRRICRQHGPIVIVALHDLNLAARYCDRLLLLSHGRLQADGSPDQVLSLESIGSAYQVETTLEQTRGGDIFVDVRLPAKEVSNAEL